MSLRNKISKTCTEAVSFKSHRLHMEKEVLLFEKRINYILQVQRRARGIKLVMYPGGILKVTAAPFVKARLVEKFIQEKAEWIIKNIEHLSQFPKRILKRTSKKEYIKHKESAKRLVEEKINYFNFLYNFSFKKITIRNQKTRWGSCSKNGNLNFNYKIALLPEELQNYIVVHELCHLKELNHGKNFWNLVSKTIPDHVLLRKQLRAHPHM